MNYQNTNTVCEAEPWGDEPCIDVPTLSKLLEMACCLGADALQMTYRMNQHMLGLGEPVNAEKRMEPKCFRDVLHLHTKTLEVLCKELSRACSDMGV